MFVSSIALSRLQAGFLVGFLEAEAHFFVAPANGGQSFCCGASLAARDDDAELITALRDVTRLGDLRPRAAYRTSKPQIAWNITRRSETAALAAVLRQDPPLGRKAGVCGIWCRAVAAWTSPACADRRAAMRRMREELKAASSYTRDPDATRSLNLDDDFDRGYVTGLVVGDGHLGIDAGGARLTVHLRDDDRPLLESLSAVLGGAVNGHRAYATSRPAACWNVCRTADLECLRSVLVMDLFPSRKQREFTIWCAAIDLQVDAAASGRRRPRELLQQLGSGIKAARRYEAPVTPVPCDARREIAIAQVRARCMPAIAVFAAEHAGPLDAMTYMAIRQEQHPEWPNRNTIARLFGSWHAALEAAGLADRAASTPERYEHRSRAVFDARQAEHRERVLASVRRFVAEVGHVPRAMEYFRWRLRHDPDTPTQATIYNLFPGGWDSVRQAGGM